MNIEDYNKNPNKCLKCKNIIPFNTRKRIRNRTYCCLKCAGEDLSYKKRIATINKYYSNPLYCNRCNNIISFEKKRSLGKLKFCSNTCSNLYYGPTKLTIDSRRKISEKSKINQAKIWTIDKRKIHSDKMKLVVKSKPESYSSNNVCGRVKGISVEDSLGRKTKCLGSWEKIVIEFLLNNSIRWINKIDDEFLYTWNGSIHRYFPDFYLIDQDIYIEVKGFERERDREKWKQFPKKLKILKLKEIREIQQGKYTVEQLLNCEK